KILRLVVRLRAGSRESRTGCRREARTMTSGLVRRHESAGPGPAGPPPAGEQAPRVLSREIIALAAVVVLGSIMTVLDATIVGVPLLLGPVAGPVIGGAIVGSASWRWIFLVNLPVGAAALALAAWLLPDTPGRRGAKLDVPGLMLLSAGISGSLYGLDRLGA